MDYSPSHGVDISERFSVNVSKFKNVLYFHLRDKLKQKSFSLKKEDFIQLCKKREAILEAAKLLDDEKSLKKSKSKHRKPWARDWDGTTDSSSEDIESRY